MIKELPPIVTLLTPELAREHAALPKVKGDRRITRKRLEEIRDKVRSRLFHSPTWAVATCKGQRHRMNGGHTSTALAMMNGEFPVGLSVTILQFECDTEDDLVTLFDQFDARWSVRTHNDSLRVHASVHESLDNISTTAINRCVSGISYAVSNDGKDRLSPDAQKTLLNQYADFVVWAKEFVGIRRMSRCGVVAAMFATWSRSPALATGFWLMVRDQNHPDPRHPTRTLGKFLEQSTFDTHNPATGMRWDTRAFYVKGVHAWNACQAGRHTDLKYHPVAGWPKVS